MQKNICIGDVVKRTLSTKTEYLVVLPFEETQADRLVVTCLKLDKDSRITKDKVRAEFRSLKEFFVELKSDFFTEKEYFREISMGMSHDYKIAIEEGATIIRIGTSIFGNREY